MIIGIELPDSAKPEEWLSALQYQNTLTIDYFEADAYSLQRQAQYGQGKIKISIGYIQDEQAYIYVSKIPQKQSLQAKSSSIMNKLAGIAEGLLS